MRGYAAIGLHAPEKGPNIGSVLRLVGCYGAAMLVTSGRRNLRTRPTDTQKSYRHTPWLRVDDLLTATPYACEPVAVEICEGAEPLHAFKHPERAYYLFGPEGGSLPEHVLKRCAHRVHIPTAFCLNLAVTVGTVLYDRQAKQLARTDRVLPATRSRFVEAQP